MARTLNADLDAAQLFQKREPAYSIEIYDLRSTSTEAVPNTINDVVLTNVTGASLLEDIVGPRDFSEECVSITMTEVAGDYTENGVASSQITFRIADPGGHFDPWLGVPAALEDLHSRSGVRCPPPPARGEIAP